MSGRDDDVDGCFFFNDTATTEIYTLSLHDALPIWKGYRRIRKLTAKKNPIIAIEAKLKKWKDAFLQIKRYKKYADYCYVALPENTLKNVDLKMFKENSIGVFAVTPSKSVYQVLKPKKNRDKHDLYTIYVNGILFNNSHSVLSGAIL